MPVSRDKGCAPDCPCRTPETATVGWGRVKWQPAEDGSNALYVFTGLKFEPVAYFADEKNAKAAVEILRRALEDATLCERGIHRRRGPKPVDGPPKELTPKREPPANLKMPEIHKNAAAVHLGRRRGGKKGGVARAKKLSKERRSEIAKKAAEARWGKVRSKPQELKG